jgi:hypothetical protein
MLVIISCAKNKERVKYIENNWLHKITIPYVIIIGDPLLTIGTYKYENDTKVLYVACDDSYDGLPFKIYTAVYCVKQLWNPEYIFKIDDDIILKPALLYKKIIELQNNNTIHYAGNSSKHLLNNFHYNKSVLNIESQLPIISYCYGPMYYLSKKAVNVIVNTMKPGITTYEDINVGYTLNLMNIFPTHASLYSSKIHDLDNDDFIGITHLNFDNFIKGIDDMPQSKIAIVIKKKNEKCYIENKKLCDNFNAQYNAVYDIITMTEGIENSYLYGMFILYMDKYDWIISIYDDSFIINFDEIRNMIDYMDINNYDMCGMPDGGTYTCRPYGSPASMNPFFNIFHTKTLRTKIRPILEVDKEPWDVDKLLIKVPLDKFHSELIQDRNRNCYELFYPLFYEILDKCNVLFLYGKSYTIYKKCDSGLSTNGESMKIGEVLPEDTITTILYSHNNIPIINYAWYSNTYKYNMISNVDNELRQSDCRIDRLIKQVVAVIANNT